MNQSFVTILHFIIFYLWFTIFSRSVLPAYFVKQGLGFDELVFGIFLIFFAQVILLLLWRSVSSKAGWTIGPLFFLVSVLLSINLTSPIEYYISCIFVGLSGNL